MAIEIPASFLNKIRPAMPRIPTGKLKSNRPYGERLAFRGVSPEEVYQNVAHVKEVLLDEGDTWRTSASGVSLKFVAEQFVLIHSADRDNWLSTARAFGYPSHILSRLVAATFFQLQQALEEKDFPAADAARLVLNDEAVVEMLENCLDIGAGKTTREEENWAFVGWSPDNSKNLPVGARAGTIASIMADLTEVQVQKAKNHGALAAWLVHDVEMAEETISRALADLGNKRGFYNVSLREARARVERVLIETNNLVVSPWHYDEDGAARRLSIAEPITATVTETSKVEAPED